MTTKSFIKTIGEKGLLADYNTEGKKLQTELIAGDNVTIDENTISSNQLFVATYGTTKYAEVLAAYNAGKLCVVFMNRRYYYIKWIDTGSILFTSSVSSSNGNDSIYSLTLFASDRWSTYNSSLQSKLTFDTTPTAASTNPVTSDGIASINGYRKLFSQGNVSSTNLDSSILFYIKWNSPTDSGLYNRQYEINYSNFRTGTSGIIKIAPNITNTTDGKINLVSDRYNFNDITFGIIEAPDGDPEHPYWFVGYGYGIGGSIETIQNGKTLTYTDRPVVVPEEQILTSACNFIKLYEENPKYFCYITYPPTTGTFVLKSIDGVIQWVEE